MNNKKATRTARIFTIVVPRSDFIKAAPILAAIRDVNERSAKLFDPDSDQSSHSAMQNVLIHTGQHYAESNVRPIVL